MTSLRPTARSFCVPPAWEIKIGDTAFDDTFADIKKSARAATSYTVGLNRYPNANSKLQLNYVRTDFSGGAAMGANRGSENALMARLQFNL